VRAFEQGAETAAPWEDAATVAFGINVASALGDFLVLSAIRDTDGTAIAVTDEEILAEQAACATTEGMQMCPEGAATLAAVSQLRASGWLDGTEEVVVLNTGSNLKYPHTARYDDPPVLANNATLPL
jgi:threonine synthase